MTTADRDMKLAGAAGILSIVLAAIGFVIQPLWDIPATGSTAAEFARFAAAHDGALAAELVLDLIAVTLWLEFGAGVWTRLRRDRYLSACFAFGLVAFVTLLLAGFLVALIGTYRPEYDSASRIFTDVTFGLLAMSGAPTALALGAAAAFTLRRDDDGLLPRWTGYLAAIGAAAHVVLLASLVVTDGPFSLEGQVITAIPATLFAWILGTSIWMVRAKHPRAAATAPAPACPAPRAE